MPEILVNIPEALLRKVDNMAKLEDRSRRAQIRVMLADWFKTQGIQEVGRPK